jgi:hypothetical protein
MEKPEGPLDVSGDILHIPSQSKLTAEQIAKAVAHHKRHHPDQPAAAGKPRPQGAGKKGK